MQTITLVTGNAGKLKEWQRLFPAEFELQAVDVDLEEIQSLDLEAIAIDKAKRAYEVVGSPVLVEDISAGIDHLKGLPGPFIKYFEEALGMDALYRIGGSESVPATVTCTIAYFDGKTVLTASGAVKGVTKSPRGVHGFGFDHVFAPDGQDKSFGEMTPQEKDNCSHRAIAVRELLPKLRSLLSQE